MRYFAFYTKIITGSNISLFSHMAFIVNIYPRRVEKQHRIERLKRSVPPFLNQSFYFICYSANQFGRHIDIINIFEMILYRFC